MRFFAAQKTDDSTKRRDGRALTTFTRFETDGATDTKNSGRLPITCLLYFEKETTRDSNTNL